MENGYNLNTLHSYNNTVETNAYYLRIIGRPAVSIVGICCNLLAISVFSRKSLRWTPSCLILKAVAVADIFVLICGFFYWTDYDLDIPSMTVNEHVCKFVTFTAEYWAPEVTASLLLLLSLERVLKAGYSQEHVIYFSVKRTMAAIITIVLFFFLLNIPVITSNIFLVNPHGNGYICWNLFHASWDILPTSDKTYYSVYRYAVLGLYGVIPYLGLPILNGWLLCKMRARKVMLSQEEQLTGRIPDPIHPMDNLEEVVLAHKKAEAHMKEMTRLVISITVCYWIFTIGFNLIQAGIYNIHTTVDPYQKAINSMMFTLFVLMFYMNHASNFFLYCLNCGVYRDEFKAMVRDMFRRCAARLNHPKN